MGFLQLWEFQEELRGILGKVSKTSREPTQLSRLVNLGYYELAGTVPFEAFYSTNSITTAADTQSYTTETNIQTVMAVVNISDRQNLRLSAMRNLVQKDASVTGRPKFWARGGGDILFHPVPSSEKTIVIHYTAEPDRLSDRDDTTAIPGIWDQAVLLLAAKAAMTFEKDFEAAQGFLNTARMYISTRMGESETGILSEGYSMTYDESGVENQ